MASTQLELPMEKIAAFCQRWKIAKLEIFGSALRTDFQPSSDVDFLATFEPNAEWSLLDRAGMQLELESLLGRRVDLLNRAALEKKRNRESNDAILNTAQIVYGQS